MKRLGYIKIVNAEPGRLPPVPEVSQGSSTVQSSASSLRYADIRGKERESARPARNSGQSSKRSEPLNAPHAVKCSMASPKIERLFVSGRYNGRNTVGLNKGISSHDAIRRQAAEGLGWNGQRGGKSR
jgi:hypothetical protein